MKGPQGEWIPTPAQIKAAAAKVRAGWDEDTEARRRTGSQEIASWTPPNVTLPGVKTAPLPEFE